ncbi:DUF2339 domain-containing protein [Kosakonia pseudosacchari]|uniref:Beta-carotene 15,15'-monooxygenase n=1 Tax=Kosakonia pseudosacchari TaxID=1646340 RepID=A0ABX4INQ1_9ENTR|nr:DUF2339 domain-containing protein [Kosakonia pseudosacchari]PDO84592.1 beta-carotene 15,15'-monooxygenase [Kosakonia pseudosacchari]
MDGLLLFGVVVLFLALVVVPIVAITAWRRSIATQNELQQLRQRLSILERQFSAMPESREPTPVPVAMAEIAHSTEPADITQPAAPAENPWGRKVEPTSTAETPWGRKTETSAPVMSVPAIDEPAVITKTPETASWGMVTSLVRWFVQGNPLAKLGVILLFIGLSFLLRYTVEYALFPLELRLAAVALVAMVLLGLGWRLRHKQTVFALILQGGAVGALYLTVFGAFRLWQMLPMTLAFVLLIVICAASVGLAVLQKALSLALLASLGGYLAPILLSTGGGSHVALFSFYLLLSVGILAISVWQHWRELNLLGMVFTFGVAGLWGMDNYRPEFYFSCQLFLMANLLIFGVLSVALSLRAQRRGERIIDGVLLFAPPLAGFGMQYAITQHWHYGPAFSALGFGLFYLALALLALKRFPATAKPLVLAALALGGAFATLAIPLALSARWTAMAWALEGLGILWLGVQQNLRRMSYSGSALLLLALCSALWAAADGINAVSTLLIFAVLSGCWLAASWLWRGLRQEGSWLLLLGGIAFWVVALGGASQATLPSSVDNGFGVLALLGLSVWLWRAGSLRWTWPELGYARWLLWPGMAVMLVWQIMTQGHLLAAGWPNLAWCVALPAALLLLYRETGMIPARVSQGLHIALWWILLLAAGTELWWFVDGLAWGNEPWQTGLPMAAGGVVIALVLAAIRRQFWPWRIWPALYGSLGLLPLVPVLLCLLVYANLGDGVVMGMPYLPVINPLEEGAAFALIGFWLYSRFAEAHYPAVAPQLWRARPWVMAALGFWWLNGALLRLLAYYGDVAWESESLWQSRLIQTSFALFWMLIALVVMIRATRQHARQQWLCGSVLLGVVLLKLMLVDSAGGGGLSRAIAFIGVAVLVLIVGYFSPLPPKAVREEDKGEEQ